MAWDYRLSIKLNYGFSDTDLKVLSQLGIKNTFFWLPAEHHTLEELKAAKAKIESYGINLHNVLSGKVSKNFKIHLGLPGRDEAIDEFITWLHWLKDLGIKYTVFTWEPDLVWSTGSEQVRGADSRLVIADKLKNMPFTHEREYTREELWDNFSYFMKAIIPEAEKTGVRLAMHPNDPPVDFPMAGVPALIHSAEDYRRAFKIAGSKALGMEFCCGCWLEGGDKGFGPILDNMAEFLEDDRIVIVHFRNISAPLPNFTETFLDNGYFDMYKLMKVLHDHDYQGTITLDHTPAMADSPNLYAPNAYATGYMRALAERAIAEGGK